jgi:mRNA interferase MazF
MSKYKIVLVPFPFDDLTTTKVRPAACLTGPIGQYNHVVLAFITSQIPESPLPTDLLINSDEKGFTETGLRVSSTLQLHRLITVSAALLTRELGVLSSAMQEDVNSKLKTLFELK